MIIKKMNLEQVSITKDGYAIGGELLEYDDIEAYKQAVSDAVNKREKAGKEPKSVNRAARRSIQKTSFRSSLFTPAK